MNEDYMDFKRLELVPGYQKLKALWIQQVSKIEEARDRAASRAQESAWRYAAGKEAGFKLAMTALDRAIGDIESKEANLEGEERMNKILDERNIKTGDQR